MVNRAVEEFEFQNCKIDHFKCLVFVCGLKAPRYADIRARLLARIEGETAEHPVTLQTLIDEFQRLVNLKADTSMIEQHSSLKSSVRAVSEKKPGKFSQHSMKTESKTPRTPCWQCGQMHFVRDCPFSTHQCKTCNQTGHKEGYCGCIKKTSDSSSQDKRYKGKKKNRSATQTRNVFIVNQIANQSRKRKFVTTSINGVAVSLQLDSASDITVVSESTWKLLKKPEAKLPSIEAVNASGEPLGLIGEFQCDAAINGVVKQERCFVTSVPDLNVLGIEWIDLFNLWSIWIWRQAINQQCTSSTPS